MALVACRECGTEISDQAAACPKCGAPPKLTAKSLLKKPILIAAVVLGFVVLVSGVFFREDIEEAYEGWMNPTSRYCQETRALQIALFCADKVILPGSPSDRALRSGRE